MRIFNSIFYHGVIIPISHLPYSILYFLSDGLYVLMYKIFGYRKKVVIQNIANSFPNKTNQEHHQITKKFYRHFFDLILESFKVFTISESEVKQRMKVINPEVINRFYDRGQNVIMAGGHYNNWELFAMAIEGEIKHKSVAIYKPLSSVYFDKKMRESRSKFGLEMISTKKVADEFKKEQAPLRAIIFGIDQSPSSATNSYWTTFLNQDTAMLFGTEKYAKEYNFPVISVRINKIKRGHYTIEFTDVIEEPTKTAYGEITKRINQMLENDIIEKPEYWLWTHKRWKRKRPIDLVQ
jgi:Kdo2-lipid IVA lauroyltransferase/acyltransferase